MNFSLKLLFCLSFISATFLPGYSFEQNVINQNGHTGIIRVYSAKGLGATRLSFNIQSDLAYDKHYLSQMIDRKGLFEIDQENFDNQFDTLFPDPTFFNMRFNAGYGITSFLDVAFMLPLYFDLLSHKKSQNGLGDLELGFKFRIPWDEQLFFQTALLSMFSFPSGSKRDGYFPRSTYYFTKSLTGETVAQEDTLVTCYSSDKMESFLAVLFSFDWKWLLFHANSGIRITHNKKLDELFIMGAALEFRPSEHVDLFTELYSQMRFSTVSDGFRMRNDPFRITPGISLISNNGMNFTLAGSFKLSSDKKYSYFDIDKSGRHFVVGIEPAWQISAQIGWNGALKLQDKDKDLILDKFDACPDIAEDADNYEDSDGCPDLDNDHDAIPDSLDKCPLNAEDHDNFEDEDGCPELDNDQDGVVDSLDQCLDVKEDRDGFLDSDGCPDYDNDNDGVADSLDKCLGSSEDRDGFEDSDGCPDLDNDLDGVPDSVDNCRDSAGVASENGCPQIKPQPKEIKRGRVILRGIDFTWGSSVLSTAAMSVLDQVFESMVAFKEINVEIQAHTDNSGNSDNNLRISQNRANACRDYLIQKGISADRLSSAGKGQKEPIADNTSAYGRQMNNRIELHRID
ncbi:MAG TPA: OmpA family protein [Chitinispirillaceae bacterium]|nr:OmpA family protein [Chitinispirillaceae bacterium]